MEIHNVSTFQKIIEVERMRSEKARSVFSMLSISASDPAGSAALLCDVIKVLSARIRCYDIMGWMDECRLGVLLPDTPAAGAQTMLGDIIASIAERHRFICSITTYPSHGAPSLEHASL